MGKILGYPCYRDFDTLDKKEISYGIDVIVELRDGNREPLFSNICKNNSQGEFEKIARAATDVLKIHPIYGSLVDEVVVEVEMIVPTISVLNKVVRNIKLNEDENSKILNILYNFGFGEFRVSKLTGEIESNFQFVFQDKFQYENEIHRGILTALLTCEMNNPLRPFFPLQQYPEAGKKCDEIILHWENEIMKLFISDQPLVLENDMGEILSSIGFSDTFLSYFHDENMIQKGILLLLQTYGKNNSLEPFTSDKYSEQSKEAAKLITKWEETMMTAITSEKRKKMASK